MTHFKGLPSSFVFLQSMESTAGRTGRWLESRIIRIKKVGGGLDQNLTTSTWRLCSLSNAIKSF